MEVVFWTSFALLIYSHLGYLGILALITRFKKYHFHLTDRLPTLSMIITAYNEEKRIRQKIDNSLSLDYPKEKLEIIIVSDGSTDSTPSMLIESKNIGIKPIILDERKGKTAAENEALKIGSGEICVFTDASTLLEKSALKEIVKPFGDSRIGCVSGEDKSLSTQSSLTAEGEGLYVRYEMLLRRLESQLGTIIGASGCFYAVRRELVPQISPELSRDFAVVLSILRKGMKIVSCQGAICYVPTVISTAQEFRRKVRTFIGGIVALVAYKDLLNPIKHGLLTLQLISHKLLRWVTPFLLVLVFLSNLMLLNRSDLFRFVFFLQLAVYSMGLFNLIPIIRIRNIKIIHAVFFFFLSNAAIMYGWFRYLSGEKEITWPPSKRYLV